MFTGKQDLDEHEHEIYTTVKRSAIMKRSIMCGQCHGLGPNLEFENPVQCATLYGSYLHNYIPKRWRQELSRMPYEKMVIILSRLISIGKKETSARLAESITLDVENPGLPIPGYQEAVYPNCQR